MNTHDFLAWTNFFSKHEKKRMREIWKRSSVLSVMRKQGPLIIQNCDCPWGLPWQKKPLQIEGKNDFRLCLFRFSDVDRFSSYFFSFRFSFIEPFKRRDSSSKASKYYQFHHVSWSKQFLTFTRSLCENFRARSRLKATEMLQIFIRRNWVFHSSLKKSLKCFG